MLLPFSSDPGTEPAAYFHRRVSEVQLTVVAEDAAGRPRRDLSAAHIAVREDGQAVQQFDLRAAADLPLRIGIVVDLSGSTALTWEQVRRSLMSSVQQLLRPEDEVLLVTFDRKIELVRTIAQPMELEAWLPRKDTGGLTALYDSLYQTCDQRDFFEDARPRHAALILFSDGEDNLSLRGLQDTIARAQQANIAIYAVTMRRRKHAGLGDAVLESIATDTGGQAFVVKDGRQLAEALANINDELRSAYLVNFRPLPRNDRPGFHRVEVLPLQPDELRVRVRAGYYARP